ncbi:hypothetical protein FKP32DRAFT_602737 [Trametes sanguinea]|nr:hypothetical protein FKP32DRAFT_602737 [Trametes sanguinea]
MRLLLCRLDFSDIPTKCGRSRWRLAPFRKLYSSTEIHLPFPTGTYLSPPVPTFPHLLRLHWIRIFNDPIQPFVGLIVPTIRDLRVHVTREPLASQEAGSVEITATLLVALRFASQRCASLKTLEIHCNDGPPLPAATAICEILPMMRSLRSLSVSEQAVMFAPALRVLSQLLSLRTLEISQFGGSPTHLDALGLNRVSSGCSLLEELRLAGSFPLVHEILRCMPQCDVRRCTITPRRAWRRRSRNDCGQRRLQVRRLHPRVFHGVRIRCVPWHYIRPDADRLSPSIVPHQRVFNAARAGLDRRAHRASGTIARHRRALPRPRPRLATPSNVTAQPPPGDFRHATRPASGYPPRLALLRRALSRAFGYQHPGKRVGGTLGGGRSHDAACPSYERRVAGPHRFSCDLSGSGRGVSVEVVSLLRARALLEPAVLDEQPRPRRIVESLGAAAWHPAR